MLRCVQQSLQQTVLCGLLMPYPRCVAQDVTKSFVKRWMSDGNGDDHCKQATFLTGGLGKFQGCLKEEAYFQNQNYKLIAKMKDQEDNKMEGESQRLSHNVDLNAMKLMEPRSLTCAACKHKNCQEEVYFLNEQMECKKALYERFKDVKILTETATKEEDAIEHDLDEDDVKTMPEEATAATPAVAPAPA